MTDKFNISIIEKKRMITTTEKYIKKAIEEAKKELGGNSISHCTFEMHLEASGATIKLAEALEEQAIANALNSQAMLKLAESLKPIDVCAVRISSEGIEK